MSDDGSNNGSDLFYVGYLPRAPHGLARNLRMRTALLLALVGVGAALLASAHARRPAARFEYGAPLELRGTIEARPCPRLIVPRPGFLEGVRAVTKRRNSARFSTSSAARPAASPRSPKMF